MQREQYVLVQQHSRGDYLDVYNTENEWHAEYINKVYEGFES